MPSYDNPYRIKSTDDATTIPDRFTFPVGTYIGGRFGTMPGVTNTPITVKPQPSPLANPGYNPYLTRWNTPMPWPNPTPYERRYTTQSPYYTTDFNANWEWKQKAGIIPSNAEILANAGMQTSSVPSTAPYRGRGGLPVPMNNGIPDTSQLTAMADKTGILNPSTLRYMSQVTGVPEGVYLQRMLQAGWRFEAGKYVNASQGQSQGGTNTQYGPIRGAGWQTYENKSGYTVTRNAHGSLISHGGGGGKEPQGPQPARWNSSVAGRFVNFMGGTG